MEWPARRYTKPALVVIVIVGALLLTLMRDGQDGLAFRVPTEPSAEQQSGSGTEAGSFRLRILSRVIMLVHERYIEPERIDQRAMLLGGLDYIQRSVAEVLLRHEEGSDQMTILVNDAEQSFSLSDLDRPWALTFRFREIFRFLRANLRDENVEISDIEYAACNGLLHTLDPHSVLLVPELYEEMRLGTRGEFGGLGIVISVRDGQLTIISPIDETPADRAGLRRMDRIVMIGDETTINMTLEEAVDRLRGPPGTDVSIRIMRRGWSEARPFSITRAVIRIESVESELLEGGVGYIKIRNFQGNTHEDLVEQLEQLRGQGMRSLILDLRDDPGGLLDQAVRVADTFLSEGVIVTTAGNDPTEREIRQARPEETEPNYPMVVLVNSGSASASEIVAGALKYNNRAMIIGERTFGKGSVQVLYDFDDGSALKLTIAHYLTPGDISIQSVGIVPDVEVLPLVVRRNRINLIPDVASVRESNLEAHLTGETEVPLERPSYQVRHYRVPDPEQPEEDEGDEEEQPQPESDDEEQPPPESDDPQPPEEPEADEANGEEEEQNLLDDFEIQLGHDLLRRAQEPNRPHLIERARPLIDRLSEQEEGRMIEGLRHLSLDWSEGRDQGPTALDVSFEAREETDEEEVEGRLGQVDAGNRIELTLRVTNTGDAPVYRLHGLTESDNSYFDDRELPLGRINPGETKSWTQGLRIPRDAHSRADPIQVELSELHDHEPADREVVVRINGLDRPTFSYAFHLVDSEHGNGDGRLSRGERVRLFVTVTNQGPGRTYNAQANIKNESGEGVLIHDGRFELGELRPGQSRTHAFELEVLDRFDENEIELELTVTDFELREEVTENLHFPLIDAVDTPREAGGMVQVGQRTPVYAWADAEAHQVGWLAEGSLMTVGAALDEYLRVTLGEHRTGWVLRRQTSEAEAAEPTPRFEIRMDNTPPEITYTQDPPLSVESDTLPLSGVVTDADRVLDMYIFVGRRKVFYLSNREGRDPRRLSFDTNLPLEPGSNVVLVVARESGDVVARRVMVVRRQAEPQQARGQQ